MNRSQDTSTEIKSIFHHDIAKQQPNNSLEVSWYLLAVFTLIGSGIIFGALLWLVRRAWQRSVLPPKSQKTELFILFPELKLIPCKNCMFFKNAPYLKCAVHPFEVQTEEAVNCTDYTSGQKNRLSR